MYKSLTKQRNFMDNLQVKLQLTSLDGWLQISKRKILKNGGHTLLKHHYNNDFERLLKTVYPEHQWNFEPLQRKQRSYFHHRFQQHSFLETLYYKHQFHSLDDWKTISRKKFIQLGGYRLLLSHSKDLFLLFSSLYPNFPWRRDDFIRKDTHDYFNSIDNQRAFLNSLFHSFQLQNLTDWLKISRKKIIKNGGASLMLFYYNNDKMKLLSSLYPHFPWSSSVDNDRDDNVQTDPLFITSEEVKIKKRTRKRREDKERSLFLIDDQRRKIERAYRLLKLKSLEGWLKVSTKKYHDYHLTDILSFYYGDKREMFTRLYPHYPWPSFTSPFFSPEYLNLIENQREMMDQIYHNCKLTSLDDWLSLSKKDIRKEGGRRLLALYANHKKRLLSSLYPHFPWSFSPPKINYHEHFQYLDNQRAFVQKMFGKLQLKEVGDWLKVPKITLFYRLGPLIIPFYSSNLRRLLSAIYPNQPWQKDEIKKGEVEYQRKVMSDLARELNIIDLNDWLSVRKIQLRSKLAKKLLSLYSFDMKLLLSSLYPHHPWQFHKLKYKPSFNYFKSKEHFVEKLKYLQTKYSIKQKKDWYRLPIKLERFDLYRSLLHIHPAEVWNANLFCLRSKKSTQRMLYIIIELIYSNYVLMENYRHPLISRFPDINNCPMEFDIFIPSYNLAFEYQGEHHYNDIPSGFANFELYSDRDRSKLSLSYDNQINIIYVPFWWDISLPSLQSTIRLFLLKSFV